MGGSFYNTVNLHSDELKQADKSASKQEEIIYDFFKKHPENVYTPFEVMEALRLNAPITSIRRAISNLTDKCKLIKTNITKAGEYGKPNYCWKIAKPQLEISF